MTFMALGTDRLLKVFDQNVQHAQFLAECEKAVLRSSTAVRFRVACLHDAQLELVPGTHARCGTPKVSWRSAKDRP